MPLFTLFHAATMHECIMPFCMNVPAMQLKPTNNFRGYEVVASHHVHLWVGTQPVATSIPYFAKEATESNFLSYVTQRLLPVVNGIRMSKHCRHWTEAAHQTLNIIHRPTTTTPAKEKRKWSHRHNYNQAKHTQNTCTPSCKHAHTYTNIHVNTDCTQPNICS